MNAALMGVELYAGMSGNNIRYIITKDRFIAVATGRGGTFKNSSLWHSGIREKKSVPITHEDALNLLRKFYQNRIPRSLVEKAEEYE